MQRFQFGKNWNRFINQAFNEERVANAQKCLLDLLLLPSLNNLNFLDIGCGSGIHSLAAFRAGAKLIISVDYDIDSVKTTLKLWDMAGRPRNWKILQGDVLDRNFMGRFHDIDIVYSWGVLHHTDDMYKAIENAALPLQNSDRGGVFCIALYSYTAYKRWLAIPPEEWLEQKKEYNAANKLKKIFLENKYIYTSYFQDIKSLRDIKNRLQKYYERKKIYSKSRGMDVRTDIRDWLGGWPMEFVHENECVEFCEKRLNLKLARMITGESNTEFVFATKDRPTFLDPLFQSRKVIQLENKFEVNDSLIWRYKLPQFADLADTRENPRQSPLLIWEDGVPLSFPHCAYESMLNFGAGRYRHWGDSIYFTTSDNSNPNTNGKKYSVTVDDMDVF